MKISQQKRNKISEQILAHLYTISPKATFIPSISSEIARDEEFVKDLLIELKKKKLVIEVNMNPKGIKYTKRKRWKLTDQAYLIYRNNQHH